MMNNINDIEQKEDVEEEKLLPENSIHLEANGDASGGNRSTDPENDDNKGCETDDAEKDDDNLPIDRGWAWVIAVVAHLNQMLKVGYMRSMGILFIEFLRVYKTSATVTTLTSGVMAAVFAISVFISMQMLVGRIPIRYIVMMGGLLSALGIIASAFAADITQLIIFHGIFIGVGNSMIHGPGLVLTGKYFKNKRGLGMAIANSGLSVGAIIFPPLVKYLLDEYGLRGTLMIIGAIELNIVAFALLMRPLESFQTVTKGNRTERKFLSKHIKVVENNETKATNGCTSNTFENVKNPHLSPMLHEQHNVRPRTFSQTSRFSQYQSQCDIDTFVVQEEEHSKDEQIKKKSLNPCATLDFSVWKNPRFLLLATLTLFAAFPLMFLAYYPAYMTDEGTSEQDSATFLSIAGGVDFFARLGFGHFSDLGYVKSTYICIFTLSITAINCHMVTFYTTYGLQLLGVILYGLFGGIFGSFIPILLMDYLGAEHLAKSLGFIMIIIGGSISVYHPVIGALKDLTGSYRAAYHSMGVAVFIGITLLLFEPLFRRCAKGREMETKITTNDNVKSSV